MAIAQALIQDTGQSEMTKATHPSSRFTRQMTINVSDRFRLHLRAAGDRIEILNGDEHLLNEAECAARNPEIFSQTRLGEIIAGLVERIEA